ncbi:hypothetical protein ABH922_000902 [Rhodococcus sp. 27YEA15]|uniref:hypothetical protein n=1 Tax=Rhodococcus sp. 27YEA15 TaxID=3156259 RepID=UPI003C79F215
MTIAIDPSSTPAITDVLRYEDIEILTSDAVLADIEPGWGVMTVVSERLHGSDVELGQAIVRLERFDNRDGDGNAEPNRWSVNFRGINGNFSEVHPSEIPGIIDTLTEMRRAWLNLDPEAMA